MPGGPVGDRQDERERFKGTPERERSPHPRSAHVEYVVQPARHALAGHVGDWRARRASTERTARTLTVPPLRVAGRR